MSIDTKARGLNVLNFAERHFWLGGDELLPTIDVVGCTRKRSIDYDVYGQWSDISWFNNSPDGKFGSKLAAAAFKFIAQQ